MEDQEIFYNQFLPLIAVRDLFLLVAATISLPDKSARVAVDGKGCGEVGESAVEVDVEKLKVFHFKIYLQNSVR